MFQKYIQNSHPPFRMFGIFRKDAILYLRFQGRKYLPQKVYERG